MRQRVALEQAQAMQDLQGQAVRSQHEIGETRQRAQEQYQHELQQVNKQYVRHRREAQERRVRLDQEHYRGLSRSHATLWEYSRAPRLSAASTVYQGRADPGDPHPVVLAMQESVHELREEVRELRGLVRELGDYVKRQRKVHE